MSTIDQTIQFMPTILSYRDTGFSRTSIEDEVSLIAIIEKKERDIWLNALEEIQEYEALGRGWDGYNAVPFDPLVLERASQIVRTAKKLSDETGVELNLVEPGPASDGSVDIEIRKDRKLLLITINPEGNELAVYFDDEGLEKEDSGVFERRFVFRWLYKFFTEEGVPSAFSTARPDSQPRETLASSL